MKTSARGIELIKQFEGLELEAYQDIAGIWTIGYGHTGPDVEPGMRISEKEAEALLRRDLTPRENAVDNLTSVPLNQNEFDALVSFVYNVGIQAYRGSTARRRLNKKDRMGAADALTWWNKATVGGVLREVQGLTRRRAAERALFLTPVNPPLVRADENLDENTRATPVEDSPRRNNPAESRTVQGATVAGGAGVAASTMGRDNAEELSQVETNIENGTGLTEDDSAGEGSTPPGRAVDDEIIDTTPTDEDPDVITDGEIDGSNDPDDTIDQPIDDTPVETDDECVPQSTDSTDGADNSTESETSDSDADDETAPGIDNETEDESDLPETETCDIVVDTGDGSDIIDHGNEGDSHSDELEGQVILNGMEQRPSKHEVHAVEAQVQFALLILIVLSIGFVIFARIDDWLKFRR